MSPIQTHTVGAFLSESSVWLQCRICGLHGGETTGSAFASSQQGKVSILQPRGSKLASKTGSLQDAQVCNVIGTLKFTAIQSMNKKCKMVTWFSDLESEFKS